jgi:hypothetical protein
MSKAIPGNFKVHTWIIYCGWQFTIACYLSDKLLQRKNCTSYDLEHQQILHLLFMRGFNNYFAIGGLGVEEQQWRSWSRDLTPCDIFLSSWTKERSLPKALKKAQWTSKKINFKIFCRCSTRDLLRFSSRCRKFV